MGADKHQGRIVVVDDEAAARSALCELLRDEGYDVHAAGDGYKALGQLDARLCDLVITDVKMPGMDGLELLRTVRERDDAVGVIVMTAYGSVESAVDAMRDGADEYLSKPVNFPELLMIVEKVLRNTELRRENRRLRRVLEDDPVKTGVVWIGQSKASSDLLRIVRQAADSDATVLVHGEAGSGKELISRALHDWGARKEHPFVALHCAGQTAQVLESDLFGHEKGAIPDAPSRRDGWLQRCDKGTIFLDEIGEIPATTQVKLLRFLQERKFERLGGDQTLSVDVRIVAATHADLERAVERETFRRDLYYRLNVVSIWVPTLVERREDIPALAMHFLRRYADKNRKRIDSFSDRALAMLTGFNWPGNARQLEQCIERAVVLCPGREIEPKHLPREFMEHPRGFDEQPVIPGATLAELEKYAILKTLEHVDGSTSRAAELLGISSRKIQYRLAEYRDADPSGVPAVTTSKASS